MPLLNKFLRLPMFHVGRNTPGVRLFEKTLDPMDTHLGFARLPWRHDCILDESNAVKASA